MFAIFFFFKQKTAYEMRISDWSSDVCSSDLIATRLAASIETALELADGIVFAENADGGEITIFSAKFACPVSGFTIEEIEPRLFSFNNPYGACPVCSGLGTQKYVDPQLVVPDERLSLREGAGTPWKGSSSQYSEQTHDSLARHYRASMTTPWRALPEAMRQAVLLGSGGEPVELTHNEGMRS